MGTRSSMPELLQCPTRLLTERIKHHARQLDITGKLKNCISIDPAAQSVQKALAELRKRYHVTAWENNSPWTSD